MPEPPTLYLFGGSNGSGKTTFARAFLPSIDPIPRFLNSVDVWRLWDNDGDPPDLILSSENANLAELEENL